MLGVPGLHRLAEIDVVAVDGLLAAALFLADEKHDAAAWGGFGEGHSLVLVDHTLEEETV